MADRRPPARCHSLGRPQRALEAERDHRFDEESLREEHTQLRGVVAALRREAAGVRDRLKAAEKDSLRKDKILHELLATGKCASGVPAEALDQLREELQGLLHFKRLAHDVRQTLEEKEQNLSAFQHELRSTSIYDMEEEVVNAKAEAKAKAVECAETGGHWCWSESQKFQRKARDLNDRILEAETQISQSQQRLIRLQDQRSKLQQDVEDQSLQIERLQEKRAEIEQQREQCESYLRDLGDVEQKHSRLQAQCEESLEELSRARQVDLEQQILRDHAASTNVGPEAKGWEVRERMMVPGFQPLRFDADERQRLQLWRIRQALEAGGGRSMLNFLLKEDADRDGYVSAEEMSNALRKLRLPGNLSDVDAVRGLIACLDPELLGSAGGASNSRPVSAVDFALAIPLQPPPQDVFDDELAIAAESLSWACRRRFVAEAELRANLGIWLSDPATDLVAKASAFCTSLGLDAKTAAIVGRGLEIRRLRFAIHLPHWRTPQPAVRAAMLARFALETARRRDVLAPLLNVQFMSLESLLHVGGMLGDHWSREEVEQVAMAAEATEVGLGVGAPPMVDGERLLRAATRQGGLPSEFPELNEYWHPDALAACDKAAMAPPRRGRLPNLSSPVATPVGAHSASEGLSQLVPAPEPTPEVEAALPLEVAAEVLPEEEAPAMLQAMPPEPLPEELPEMLPVGVGGVGALWEEATEVPISAVPMSAQEELLEHDGVAPLQGLEDSGLAHLEPPSVPQDVNGSAMATAPAALPDGFAVVAAVAHDSAVVAAVAPPSAEPAPDLASDTPGTNADGEEKEEQYEEEEFDDDFDDEDEDGDGEGDEDSADEDSLDESV